LNTGTDCSDETSAEESSRLAKWPSGKARSPMVERRVGWNHSLSVHYVCTVCPVCTGYEQRRAYFVVACPNTNSVHTCSQFAEFKFWKTVSPTRWIRPWNKMAGIGLLSATNAALLYTRCSIELMRAKTICWFFGNRLHF